MDHPTFAPVRGWDAPPVCRFAVQRPWPKQDDDIYVPSDTPSYQLQNDYSNDQECSKHNYVHFTTDTSYQPYLRNQLA